MKKDIKIEIKRDWLPSEYADYLGVVYSNSVSKEHKKTKGQFFTPTEISDFMGKVSTNKNLSEISILDPGCGTGILTCSLIENLINKKTRIIRLVAYETDFNLFKYTEKSLQYLKKWLNSRNIEFTYLLFANDFIVDMAISFQNTIEKFDYIISNPPYFKLAKNDKRVLLLKNVVDVQPNIYSLFMVVSVNLLKENGEMVFITPRSFASGQYFNSFRDYFFNNVNIELIHLFKTRNKTFNRDKVLQELLIIKATKQKINKTVISTSEGLNDISKSIIRHIRFENIINLNTKDKTLFLPTTEREIEIINLFKAWKNRLIDYDIQVSTGRVVAFRNKQYLNNIYKNTTVFLAPLFWLHNVNKMKITWPLLDINKSQYIIIRDETKSILLPNKNYIFLRRFSTKDDKSRLICAPYFASNNQTEYIGVENKLNYIYKINSDFDNEEMVGIATLLNSDIYDTYFRTFNGNVNVSATEIRLMTFPSIDKIKEIGKAIISTNDFSQSNINKITNSILISKNIVVNV